MERLPTDQNTQRLAWVDTFRAMAMFAIVWGHALGVPNLEYGPVNRYLYSFHVAAFFFLSGYLFRGEGQPFGAFAWKKVKTLLIPYYLFALLSIGIFVVLGSVVSESLDASIKSTDILPNILGMLYGSGATGYMKWNRPLWFIPCLFAMTVLFYGIRILLEKLSGRIGKNRAMGAALIASFALAFANYSVFKLEKLPFGLETVVYMLPFFMTGYWVQKSVDFAKLPAKGKLVAGVLGVAVGAALSFAFQKRVGYSISRYENLLVFYLCAFSSVLGYTMLTQFVSGKLFSYVGRNTLPILLMHKFPIVFFQLFLTKTMAKSDTLGVAIALVMAVAACAMSLVAGEIITRICPFALGKRKKKR